MALQACWGRGSASRTALLLWLGCALWCSTASAATTLTVGASSGWTLPYNYTTWAAGQSFALGDVLFFSYGVGHHDVAVVSKSGYDSCANASNDVVYKTGSTNVTINTTSSYYICTYPGHCLAGMKLAVIVGGTNSSSPGTSNSTSNGTKSSAVPLVTSTQLGYFSAIFSALFAGFIL